MYSLKGQNENLLIMFIIMVLDGPVFTTAKYDSDALNIIIIFQRIFTHSMCIRSVHVVQNEKMCSTVLYIVLSLNHNVLLHDIHYNL